MEEERGFLYGRFYIAVAWLFSVTGLLLSSGFAIRYGWRIFEMAGTLPEPILFLLIPLPCAFLLALFANLHARRDWAFVGNLVFLAALAVGGLFGAVGTKQPLLLLLSAIAIPNAIYFMRRADLFPDRPAALPQEAVNHYDPPDGESWVRSIWNMLFVTRVVITLVCAMTMEATVASIPGVRVHGSVPIVFVCSWTWVLVFYPRRYGPDANRRATYPLLAELIYLPAVLTLWLSMMFPFVARAFHTGSRTLAAVQCLFPATTVLFTITTYRLRKFYLAFRTRREELVSQSGEPTPAV